MNKKLKSRLIRQVLATAKFKNDMQKLCDKKDSGFTSISISCSGFENGKEIIIAKSKDQTA